MITAQVCQKSPSKGRPATVYMLKKQYGENTDKLNPATARLAEEKTAKNGYGENTDKLRRKSELTGENEFIRNLSVLENELNDGANPRQIRTSDFIRTSVHDFGKSEPETIKPTAKNGSEISDFQPATCTVKVPGSLTRPVTDYRRKPQTITEIDKEASESNPTTPENTPA